MNKFEILNESTKLVDNEIKILEEYTTYVLEKNNLDNVIFNIILVDENYIKELNNKYRHKDEATDVITFALEDVKDIEYQDFRLLGDIYISLAYIEKQAKEFDNTYENELLMMTTHGILHLLGYDHIEEKDKDLMFEKQEMILNEYSGTKKEN